MIVSVLVIVIFSVSYFIYWFKKESGPVSASAESVRFVVEKGRSASEVGEQLYRNDLIRNRLVFKLYVQLFNKTKNINAGEFELSPSMGLPEIVNTLGKGPKELWVTIPEGLRKEEVVGRLIQALEVDESKSENFKDDFLNFYHCPLNAQQYKNYLIKNKFIEI